MGLSAPRTERQIISLSNSGRGLGITTLFTSIPFCPTTSAPTSTALCTAANPGSEIDLLVTVGAASPTLAYPLQNTTLSAALTSGSSYTTLSVNATTAASGPSPASIATISATEVGAK